MARRVFLTGHTGFKGAWLSLWLEKLGAEVSGYALPPTSNLNLFELGGVADRLTANTMADVRDLESLRVAMVACEPDVVIHMAAQALVRPSYSDPLGTFAINVMGTAHVLDVVRSVPSVRAVVVVTSDKCYENREWDRGYVETDAMGGYDPYSSSKGCAELVTAAYRRSFFHPDTYAGHRVAVASARAGNVIGGGDWAVDRLIPDAMRAFQEKTEFVVRFPEAIRPWQHVLEPLSGYLQLAQRLHLDGPAFADAWNFGPDVDAARPVKYLAEYMTELWGDGRSWRAMPDRNALHEAHYLKLDVTKARRELGWMPRLELDEALAFTVDWYKAHGLGQDMREFSLSQISEYLAKAPHPADAG